MKSSQIQEKVNGTYTRYLRADKANMPANGTAAIQKHLLNIPIVVSVVFYCFMMLFSFVVVVC